MSFGSNIKEGSIILLSQKWYEPRRSSWERVSLEDPLDPPPAKPPKPEPYVVTNETITTITIDTETTGATSTTFPVYIKFDDGRVARMVRAGTMTIGQDVTGMGTSVPYANNPPPRFEPPLAPWPRNHRERRILKSLGKRVAEALHRAEKALGPRHEAKSQTEWNGRFWEFLVRPKQKQLDRV